MSNGAPETPTHTQSSSSQQGRRASIAPGTPFTDFFARSGNAAPPAGSNNPRGSIVSAAQAPQQRRMSLTTLGLSGSPPQPPTLSNPIMRRGSVSSSVMSSSPTTENAVMEENEEDTPMTSPATPFARRVSIGAQGFRDRVGSGSGNAGERFNWAEALRNRAERAPSLGSYPPTSPTTSGPQPASAPSPKQNHHQRAASIAIMEQPAKGSSQTNQQQAQKPKSKPKPDYFQEKILKADFMD